MKRGAIAVFIGLCFVMAFFCSSPTFAADNVKFYLEGEVGCTFVNFDSGGFNTLGAFPNTGDDWDIMVVPGVHAGAELYRFLRADIGFHYRGDLDFRTNSIGPPYYYDTEIDTYTFMFSLYLEPFHFKKWTPYAGAGFGAAWIEAKTDDTVVEGSDNEMKFAWQAEAGIQYELTQHFMLRLGYRYIDMGSIDLDLNPIGLPGVNAGTFKGDLTAHEILFGVRYRF